MKIDSLFGMNELPVVYLIRKPRKKYQKHKHLKYTTVILICDLAFNRDFKKKVDIMYFSQV